jgi:hypothetical protein
VCIARTKAKCKGPSSSYKSYSDGDRLRKRNKRGEKPLPKMKVRSGVRFAKAGQAKQEVNKYA